MYYLCIQTIFSILSALANLSQH